MKIKIIDLLNKWVNGEEMPQKIMFDACLYTYNEREKTYYNEEEETLWQNYNFRILPDEVEIIGELKKIKKIRIDHNSINIDKAFETGTTTFFREKDIEIFQCLSSKINELIDEINNLKEK